MRVLVVDDEENIVFLVASALSVEGYEVLAAHTVSEARELLRTTQFNLAILDVMLPDDDGFSLVEYMRNNGVSVPVIFLSAKNSVDDRIRGLTIGGDDYLGKPFSLAELVARVRLRLGGPVGSRESNQLSCGDLTMSDDTRTVTRGNIVANLTRTEYELLRYLLLNKGIVLSREKILDHVWDYSFQGSSSVLDTFMSNLRRKIDHTDTQLIHTIRGVGYSMREPA